MMTAITADGRMYEVHPEDAERLGITDRNWPNEVRARIYGLETDDYTWRLRAWGIVAYKNEPDS